MSKKKDKGSRSDAATQPNEEAKSSSDGNDNPPEFAKAEEDIISEPELMDDGGDDGKEFSALSKNEREALKKKAKEMAKKETKQEVEDKYLKAEVAKAKEEEKSRLNIKEDVEKVRHTVELSSASDHILINGKRFNHGETYEVTLGLKSALLDIEHRGHQQERIRKGQDLNEYGLRDRNGIKSGSGVVKA